MELTRRTVVDLLGEDVFHILNLKIVSADLSVGNVATYIVGFNKKQEDNYYNRAKIVIFRDRDEGCISTLSVTYYSFNNHFFSRYTMSYVGYKGNAHLAKELIISIAKNLVEYNRNLFSLGEEIADDFYNQTKEEFLNKYKSIDDESYEQTVKLSEILNLIKK